MLACISCFAGSQEDHQKGRCVIDKATQEAISQQANLLSGDKGIADGALAALRNVQLGLCDLAGGATGGVPARLVETLQIALSAAVARLYGLDGSLGTPEGLVLLGSSYCKRENLDNNGAASQRANVRNPHTGAAAFIGGPGSMEGCGRDEGGLFPGFCMHMPTDTAVRRGMPGSRDAGPAATEITPQQHFLLHRAIASKIPVHYHMPNDPALHGESSSSSALPEDCMYDAAQYGSRHFAALPLTIRGRLSAVLWLSARATDRPAVQILSHPPSLHQLALSASLCLAATSTAPGAATLCAPSGPDVVAWLAARLRRLAGATSLRNLVSELTETLVQHIRLDFLLDARVQTALVPHPFASTAFLLKPVLPPASSVEANVSFVEGQQGLRKGLVKDLLCNPLGASKLASGPQERTHQRHRSISQNAIHRLPTDQNTGPNAANSAVATAPTNSSAFQRRRSLMEGLRSGSGSSTLPTCPNARVVRLFPTTTAGHLTGEFVRHLETPTGSRPATPRGGPSNATRVASLRAKAFHLSHTLMQRMVTHRLAATQAAGAPTVGSESERRVMVNGGAETKHRGVLCGPTVTNCGLWVQNVRHPSRDVYLLMAAAAASTLPSTTTVGSSVGSGGSQGVQALMLIGIEAGDGDDGREAAAGSGGDHKVLGLYLLFGSQLPMKLLQAVNANCRDLLGRVLAPLIRAKLSKDLAAELNTVTAGVPGTYAVLSASTSAVAPANPLPNTSGFLGGTAVNPVLLEPFISTAGSTGGPITSGCTQPYVETLLVPPGRMAHLVTRHVDSGVILHDHTEGNATGAPAFLVPFGERGGGGGSVEGSVGGSGADGGPELLLVPYMMPEMGSQEGEITMGAATTAANTQLNDGSTPPARFDGQARTAPCASATDPVSNMGGTRGSRSAAHRLAAPPIEVPINRATLNALPSGNTRTQQGPKVVPRKGVQTDATTLTTILSVQEVDASSALATHMGLLVDAITTTLRASRTGMKTATTRQSEEQSRFLMESCGGPPVDDDLEDLHLFDILGEGSSGVVLRGILGTSPVAVKLMELPDDSEDEGASSPGASMATARSRREAATAAAAAAGVQGVDTHPRHSRGARFEMSRTMLRNAMELAVLRTVSHVNIIQCHAVYYNVRIVKLPGGPGKPPVCMLRRAKAEPEGADGHTAAGGSADPSFNIAPPLCTAIVTELCTHGSLAGLLYERSFPRVQPLAPGHAAYNDVRARYDMQGVYLTLLEIALALRHLHARRLVHRDIKPANILLKACSSDPRGWTCKLADFGFALVLDQQQQVAVTPSDASSTTAPSQSATRHQPPQGNPSSSRQPAARGRISLCSEFEERGSVGAASLESGTAGLQQPTWFTVQEQACGTVTHMAPEAMHSYSRIDASVDVFSFGIMMWELLCGKGNRPYPRLTPDDIPRAVLAGMRPTFTDETPSAYRRLAQACWSVDPRCRPGASELVAAIKSFMGEHARNSPETAMAVTKA